MKHALIALAALSASTALADEGERISVTGEAIDTWCYFSGVMGPSDAVVGSAHHTCALWCAAGGIPVGLLTEDGDVYMVLKIADEGAAGGGDTYLRIASHQITAEGRAFRRDGVNYLIVEQVVADEGLINATHDEWGVVPPFAIPEPKE